MIKCILFFLAVVSILSGCVTPPRQYTNEDLTKETMMIDKSYKKVHSNLITGFRTCGSAGKGTIFANCIGVPECNPDVEGANYLCDVYLPHPYGGRLDHVLGIIKIYDKGDSTTVEFNRPIKFERTSDYSIIYWKNFINGDYNCQLNDK